MPDLLLGCGHSRKRKLHGERLEWSDLVTLDCYAECNPDVVHDLNALPYPFADNQFDEIHAYDVLEHQGAQGDWRFFFAQWSEFWRILKPKGLFFGISPHYTSPWAWGDPGHTRIIGQEQLIFLSQKSYEQVGQTAMTDYRPWWKGDFDPLVLEKTDNGQFIYALQAVK